jgi:Asp-tRNA(Asn)/Glu-tRNA(Gln) amidotransferase A subunit family amidase
MRQWLVAVPGPGPASRNNLVRPRPLAADLRRLGEPDGAENLVAATCERIAAVEPVVHAFVPEPDRQGRLMHAVAAARGPWRGVSVGVKDIIRVDGLPTRAGSDLPETELAGPQASVVTRLLGVGALVAGKTVTAEFAVVAPGPTANPHALGHTPGGSSSGSAAAVAAGMVPLALGTQTIASIIRPAAYCGVVGFRASRGRVGLDGVLANSPSLDALGWFTADVESAALAAEIIVSDWRGPVGASSLVLGVPSDRFLAEASAEARQVFADQLRVLRDAGYQVRRASLFDDFEEISRQIFVINRWELAAVHSGWFSRHEARYRPETATAIRQGQDLNPDAYQSALAWLTGFVESVTETSAAAGVDVWLTPSATGTAPAGLGSTGNSVMSVPFSLLGGPAVSVPAGADHQGLPWGLQCAGLPGTDEQLMAAAAGIETVIAAHRTDV